MSNDKKISVKNIKTNFGKTSKIIKSKPIPNKETKKKG